MSNCTNLGCLKYIGALEDDSGELLQFHSSLLAYQIEALDGLEAYHRSFPWRTIELLDATSWTCCLKDMEQCWNFTVDCVDLLQPQNPLYYELAVTRFQAFRDCMTRAE